MPSVVIAAHNEAAVIERCLDALAEGVSPGEFDVTVVANGCTDDTAARAAAHPGVRVLDLSQPGKAAALNAGDLVAQGFPRIYLDADILVSGDRLRTLCQALTDAPAGPLVVVPRRHLDVSGRPLLVRAYYAIQVHLPAFDNGLFGRGVIALSGAARARFDRFPDLVADDLFLDSLFTAAEKQQVNGVVSVVATPRRTRDLVRRLVRVRRGNADLRAAGGVAGTAAGAVAGPVTGAVAEPVAGAVAGTVAGEQPGVPGAVRRSAPLSWLLDVVLPRPWLAPAAVCYVGITLTAALLARRPARPGQEWVQDESSRREEYTRRGTSGQ